MTPDERAELVHDVKEDEWMEQEATGEVLRRWTARGSRVTAGYLAALENVTKGTKA